MQSITTIGLDIAKSVFQVHGVDAVGQVVIRRQLKRRYVLKFFEKLPPCLVGIEACACIGTRHGRHKVLKAAESRLVFRRGRTTGVAWQIRQRRAQWKRRPAAQQDCSEPQNAVAWGSSGPALAACEAMARNFPTGA